MEDTILPLRFARVRMARHPQLGSAERRMVEVAVSKSQIGYPQIPTGKL